tara:strand:- start:133 stop:501 length:369 start_codon:yes stop_codon:yes gene_type:complete
MSVMGATHIIKVALHPPLSVALDLWIQEHSTMGGQYNRQWPNGRNQFGITPEDLDPQYWFGFRQVIPSPPGQAIAKGPFDSFSEAERESEKFMGPDTVVSAPFIADSEKQAFGRAEELTGEK